MLDVKALLLTLVGCMALPGIAWAQNADLQLAPSPATQCLTPGPAERGEPEYPFAPWKRGEGGRVLVELTFGGPELAPAVDVVQASGDSELVGAVKRFDWLATLTLDLRERQLDSVLGDTLKLTIPCVKIQLDPKEKS